MEYNVILPQSTPLSRIYIIFKKLHGECAGRIMMATSALGVSSGMYDLIGLKVKWTVVNQLIISDSISCFKELSSPSMDYNSQG